MEDEEEEEAWAPQLSDGWSVQCDADKTMKLYELEFYIQTRPRVILSKPIPNRHGSGPGECPRVRMKLTFVIPNKPWLE